MAYEIKTKGIVLHEMPIGESDKRVILLTKEKGKITTFARGARKVSSKLLAGTGVFSYGDYIIFKGKSAYNMSQVQLIESFHGIRESIEHLAYGLYVLEFAEFVTEENNPNNNLLRLILKTLQMLVKDVIDNKLVIRIFELKAMSLIGYTPEVTECVNCHIEDGLLYFSTTQGGMLCKTCANTDKSTIRINKGTLYTLQYILSSSLEHLYSFKVDESISSDLDKIMKRFLQYHLNKKFKSLDFLMQLLDE